MKPTVSDIAKAANVSSSTVSRVIHGRENVKDETRKTVQQVIKELQYKPKTIVSGFNGESRLVALILGDLRNPFYSGLAFHLQKEFTACNYMVAPFSTEFDQDRELALLSQIAKNNLAALVWISSLDNERLKGALEGIPCPAVLLDRVIESFSGNVVIQDNFQGGYIATKYLIDLGHHEIAFLAGNINSASSNLRVDGYRKALSNAFLPIREDLIMPGEMSIERGYKDGLWYLDNIERLPRAALMVNDMTALGFLDACKERGVRVPEDISIVSFDDIEMSSLKSVNLTTVRQPIEEMAKKICESVCYAIDHPDRPQNNRVMLEAKLIVRGSACAHIR